MEYAGIYNVNEYYTNHYFSTIFEENAAETIKAWRDAAKSADGKAQEPWAALKEIGAFYARIRERGGRIRSASADAEALRDFADRWLDALGYSAADPQTIVLNEKDPDSAIPVYLEIRKSNGSPLLWILLAQSDDDSEDNSLLSGQLSEVNDSETGNLTPETCITKIFFEQDEPPRWIILIGQDEIDLIDRNKWNEKRYLRFDMEELYSRREDPAFKQMAVLLHHDSLCPKEGSSSLDRFDEESHKHASGVSKELKKPLREAVELLGNEVLYYYRKTGDCPFTGLSPKIDAGELTLECLRYMYRMLFVLFIEARPELGYAPMLNQVYASGYSLENLRDIVADSNAETGAIGEEYFLHESITKLFSLIYKGYPEDDAELKELSEKPSVSDVYALEPLKAHIFDPEFTPLLEKSKLRNRVWLKIIDLMSITPSTGRRGERRGRISYAALGINQMGAVYEALLSYRGFIAEEDLYEVKRKGDKFDELEVGYFVPERDLDQYDEDERVRYESGEQRGKLRMYPKGTFIYRLAGREREKSASYYTPESLTKCLVKYALKELLEGKSADEILELKICEPAMGSAAFLNEAINQLAEAYLERKQREPGMEPVSVQDRMQELQRVKMFIADRNVYGVDLNPVAVELAEVSLWLNTIYKGGYVPWFSTQLVNGNSLIGARRQVYDVSQLTTNRSGLRWYENAPERIMPETRRDKEKQIYHFLLGDPGMANYTDKVIKDLAPEQIKTLKAWNKEFNKPWENDDIAVLKHLSQTIDHLWALQLDQRRELDRRTSDPLSVYGHKEKMDVPRTTIREKDAIYHKLYKTEDAANAGPYARLKFAMDFWCALWFWPIEKADLIPTRSQFLMYMALILDGGLRDFSAAPVLQPGLFQTEKDERTAELSEKFGNTDLNPVDLNRLCETIETLRIVREIAAQDHFMHWELEFADVFEDHGGFDLMIGNPPWIKLEWEEKNILSDSNPNFAIKKLTATQTSKFRVESLKNKKTESNYFTEYQFISGEQLFLSAFQNYSILKGMATNLFKCFLPQSWTYNNKNGVSAFVHPDGVYDDPKGGYLRDHIYNKLCYHFQFENELGLFEGTNDHGRMRFSLNVYKNGKHTVSFDSISNLFLPQTITDCYEDKDVSDRIPGIKDAQGNWNIIGHFLRIVHIEKEQLLIFAGLFDSNDKWRQAKLPGIHAQPLLDVLQCFSKQINTIGKLGNNVFGSTMLPETGAQDDGTIIRNIHFPKTLHEMVYSGPHINIANPLAKTSRSICVFNGDYDCIDLSVIPNNYLQRCNYLPDCSVEDFNQRTPNTPWGTKYHNEYKIVNRAMLNLSGERTLISTVIPKGTSHIHTIFGIALKNKTILPSIAGCMTSIPFDYFIKITNKGFASFDVIKNLPVIEEYQIGIRLALLVCLSVYYADLWNNYFSPSIPIFWSKKDKRLNQNMLDKLSNNWSDSCVLKSDYERRQALLEIDVLVAIKLGMSLSQLKSIYQLQFPVLQQNELNTWYDQNGRIVFTSNKGLPNVGFSRPEWEKIKDAKSGIYTRTIIDDTMPGGPVERVIEYVAPFDRCDREQDYETAWKFFEEKYGTQVSGVRSQVSEKMAGSGTLDAENIRNQKSEIRNDSEFKKEQPEKPGTSVVPKSTDTRDLKPESSQKPVFGQPLKKPKQEPLIPKPTKEEQAGQSTFLEYAYYRCPLCGKLVMSFDRTNHESKHPGKKIEWKKVG